MTISTDTRKRGPHAERRRATRQQILNSAMEVVRTKSFQGATVFEVAKHADVTPGAVQHHFASKADLMMEIVDEILRAGQDSLGDTALPRKAPVLRARAYVQKLWSTVYEPPRFLVAWSIYFGCTTDTEACARLAERRAELAKVLHQGFVAQFPELAGARGIDSFIDLVFSALRGIAIARLFGPQDDNCRAQLEQLAQTIRHRIERVG